MSSSKEQIQKEKKRRRPLKTDTPSDHATKKLRAVTGTGEKSQNSVTTGKDQRAIFFQEENDIDRRDAQKDVCSHTDACKEIRSVLSQVKAIKVKGSNKADAAKLEELKVHGSLQFVTLKRLNRFAHFRAKKAKDKTSEAKLKIDQQHLKLQNLLYEVMHLQKEITKCLEFKSKDEEISLVPVTEFYQKAPEAISKPGATKADPHQQTLARLDWELDQRKQLSGKLKETQSCKDVMSKEINSKKDYLDSLHPMLNTILQSTKPVQEHLMMPFDEIREQHKTSTYLPRPLYVLYMQMSAYRDAVDKKLSIAIEGDVDVARSMDGSAVDLDEESDSDQEQEEKPREKRRRRNTDKDRATQRRQRGLKKHPLSVHVKITCEGESVLFLNFSYMLVLEVVTVTVKLDTASDAGHSSISGGDLLSPDTLLSCLYPGDVGNTTPNPSNIFVLQRLGLGEFESYVEEVGRPYLWVQSLCGLLFLPDVEAGGSERGRPQASVSARHMEDTLRRLRQRIQARLSLQKQLASLEKCSIPISAAYIGLYHAKITSRLTQWKRTSYEDYAACSYTQRAIDAGLATDTALYYSGLITRGSAQLHLQVVMLPDYPETAPVFALSLQWQSEITGSTNDIIRDMEAEVNIFYVDELNKGKACDELLSNQLQRLLMCMDVYLEIQCEASGAEGPIEFAKEKICPRSTRGPSRSRPFKYDPRLGFFLQR